MDENVAPEGTRLLNVGRFVRDWYRARSSRARIGAALGLAVWVSGFWAVSLMWLLGDWEPGQPGAFAFKSFAVGDGFILPVATAVLFAAGRWEQGFHGRRRALLVVTAIAGLAVGAYTQYLWLSDPHVVTNWSLPRPHHFTYSGWYHAGFLTVMFAILPTLAMAAAVRWREDHRAPAPTNLDGPLLTRVGGFLLLAGFFSLWLIDTSTIHDPLGGLAVSALVVPLAVATALVATARGERRGVAQVSALIVLGLAALILVAVAGVPSTAEYGLVTVAFGLFSVNLVVTLWNARRDPGADYTTPVDEDMERFGFIVVLHLLAAFVGASIPLYILERYHLPGPDYHGMSVASGIAMTAIALTVGLVIVALAAGLMGVSVFARRYRRTVLVTAGLFVALLGFGAITSAGNVGRYYDAFVLVWATFIIAALFYVKYLMRVQIEAEDRGEMAVVRREGEWPHPAKAMTYVWSICALLTGALLYTAKLAMESDDTALTRVPPTVAMALVPAVLLTLLGVCLAIAETGLRGRRRVLLAVIVAGGLTLVAASAATMPWAQMASSGLGRSWVSIVVIVFPVLGLAGFIVEALLGNAFLLRAKRIQALDITLAVAVGAVVAVGLATGMLAVVFVSGVFGSLILAATYAGVLALPRVAAYAWMDDDLRTADTKTSTSAGIVQDTFLSTFLCLFVMGIPFYSVMANKEVPSAIIQSMAFLSAIGAIYGWSVSLNLEHAKRFADDVASGTWPPEGEEWHYLDATSAPRILNGHIRRQCLISVVMLVPVIPFVFSQLDVEGALFAGSG